MVNFEEQIKLLIELQRLDSQILKIEEELNRIPERIGQIESDFSLKSVNLKKHEEATKMLQLKRKEKEGELQAKEETVKKYTSQMHQVKTNKEYSALQDEIGKVKADSSVIEDTILKIFDQVDEENRQIVTEKEFLKKEEAAMAQEKKVLNAEAIKIKEDADRLKIQRSELTVKIDQKILSKYDRILANKEGLAVVPIVGDSCQGCFSLMPAQVINEVRMKDAIVCCEGCTRMLYIEE